MKKIAVVTEDGTRISNHFGHAPLFKVYSVEAGQVLAEEERQKSHYTEGHHHGRDAHHHHQGKGRQMFQIITDCQVLISGGIGQSAFEKARSAGMDIFLSGGEIETAVEQYLRGELVSDERRIHKH